MQVPIIPFRGQKRPWNSIPRINWKHALATGLVFYGYDTGSGVIVDLVSGADGVKSAAFGPKPSPLGQAQLYSSGGPRVEFANSQNAIKIFPATRYSIATGWYITALPSITFTVPFGIIDNASNAAVEVLFNQTTNTDMQVQFANTSGVIFSGNSINTFHTIVGTNTTATSQIMYFDGRQITTSAITSAFTATAYQASINNGQIGAPTGNGISGWVYFGALWNRPISATSARTLHDDPWCFLIWPEDEIFATLVGSSASSVFTWSNMDNSAANIVQYMGRNEMVEYG